MSALDIISRDGTLVVSSDIIAAGSGVQHKNVLELVDSNVADFKEFGQVAFETRPGYNNSAVRVALLNEQQATLLMTYQRNSEQVRVFKKTLVRAFFDMARKDSAPVPQEAPELLVARALIEAAGLLEASKQQVADLTPRAEAWDELASATGDYEVADAAKILARAGIETGRQRLFEQIAGLGWTFRQAGKWKARQTAVDMGYLAEKPQFHYHPGSGERVIDAPQVRVTVKGLERLRVRLGVLSIVEAV